MSEVKEEMGMTDLQFKSYLKQLIRNIEEIKKEESKEKMSQRIDDLVCDLRDDLQG